MSLYQGIFGNAACMHKEMSSFTRASRCVLLSLAFPQIQSAQPWNIWIHKCWKPCEQLLNPLSPVYVQTLTGFSPGLTAPTPWSVPRCPNPWNTSASFWRPGCWKLEFYYLKGHAVKGHHWDSSDFVWNCLYKPSVSVILTVCSTNLVTIGDPINSY